MGETIAKRVRIRGNVQGVFFRAWTEEEATKRGLKGFVRNRKDGTVEALFAGPRTEVEDMIAACHRGPPQSTVDKVETEDAEGLAPDRFETKPTV